MAYKIIKIYPDGRTEEEIQAKAPDYKALREFVGGLIQYVPHLSKAYGLTRGQMVVNEEGLLYDLPFNKLATDIWLENLGKGPFSYEPRIVGNAIYWAKVK